MMSRLSNLLLGPPGRQRSRVVLTVLTLCVYALFAVLQHIEVLLGFIDPRASAWLTAYYLLGSIIFYFLLRTGWSERFPRDPSLIMAQMVHGVLATVGSYAITGPARGAVLGILVLLLAYGMFGLSVRQARLLALFSFVVLAVTMAWKCQTDPVHYPPWVEAVHLAFGLIVLLGVSALSVRMGALRARLRTQKQELEQSLERIHLLATQDELTGLANRRHMMALLKGEMARAQRTGQPLSVALFDLDRFKRINDTYGHQAGDIVLMGFAEAANRGLRSSDVLARWGGEEFLLMLPNTGTDEAGQCVVRMRKELSRIVFEEVAPGLRVTFSAGLTTFQAGESLEALTERADRAMYRAKAEGRNCTVRA
jgi:diguanylate cyclase (GGDEF)-like protein